jgi:hypothetical protein
MVVTNMLLEKSPTLTNFEWLGEVVSYPDATTDAEIDEIDSKSTWFTKTPPAKRGDTYPITSAGDPHWGRSIDGLDIERFVGYPPNYVIQKVNEMDDYTGWGGDGPKPSGMICVDGVLYLAFQNLLRKKPPTYGQKSQHGSDAHIIRSEDYGQTWIPAIGDIIEPMFPGSTFGGPAFINYGRNNAGARDSYVYALSTDQWDNGTHLRLGRVSANQIQERAKWEFVGSFDDTGMPLWSAEQNEAIPVLSLERGISLPEMVYIAALERYLLLTWQLNEDFSPSSGTKLVILDAPEPWGPFSHVHSEAIWETVEFTPYCPRIPLKWLRQIEDGIEGWMQFSGSWCEDSLYYRSHVRRFRIRQHKKV